MHPLFLVSINPMLIVDPCSISFGLRADNFEIRNEPLLGRRLLERTFTGQIIKEIPHFPP